MLHMTQHTPNTTHAQALVAMRAGRPLADLLRDLYTDRGLSMEAVAAELGVSRPTVAAWLREAGIARRAPGSAA